MLGAPSNVKLLSLTHFKHNYNYVSRAGMYHWVNKHFGLGHTEPIVEEDYPRLTPEQLTVWDDEHPKPAGGEPFERELLRWWHEDAEKQLNAAVPKDRASLEQYKEFVGGAIDAVIGEGLPEAKEVEFEQSGETDKGQYVIISGLLRNKRQSSELPAVLLRPKDLKRQTVVWLHEDGKSGLFRDDGAPKPPIRRLLEAGAMVVGVDLLYQGEFLSDGKPITKTRRVNNTREAAAYTFGFNHTLFARRVHDVLTAIAFVRHRDPAPEEINLIGIDGSGHWASAARAQARNAVRKAAVVTAGFRFGHVLDIHSPDFLPGGAKYHDLPGMLAVAAPAPLWVAGEGGGVPTIVAAAYQASGKRDSLNTFDGKLEEAPDAAVSWLLDKGGQR
jgi:hypothetical protein